MIEELRIQNFQAHRKLRVVFSPTITTIVGGSDRGKSSILRALRWCCTNAPGGDAFVRHGAEGATVAVVVDGRTVSRRRKVGGDKNTYHLDGEEFKAFGRGVPDTIAALLNMPGVCWQGQHDASFWFGESAGEVSRQLNAIVNLGIIDISLTNVGRVFRTAKTRLEVAEEDLTHAKAALVRLKWVPEADADLLAVEAAEVVTVNLAARGRVVRILAAEVRTHHKAAAAAHKRHVGAEKVLEAGLEARTKALGAANLRRTIAAVVETKDLADIYIPPITPMASAHTAQRTAWLRADSLSAALTHVLKEKATLCQRKKDYEKAQAACPAVCPTCGAS
jgi:hypothetical protein